jgi:hypothetical protein
MRLFLLTPAIAFGVACSVANGGLNQPSDSNPANNDTGSGESPDTGDDADQDPHQWVGFDAVIHLTETHASATVQLNFYPDAVDEGPSCTLAIEMKNQALQASTPDESVLAWWDNPALSADQRSACEGAARLPNPIQLGLGQLHTALLPYLSEAGVDAENTKDYAGAYIGFNASEASADQPGTAFLLGYAQSEAAESTGAWISGSFSLKGVFLFPLNESTDTGFDHGGQ